MIIKKTVELSGISNSILKLKCDIMTAVSSGPTEEARKHLTEQHIIEIFEQAKKESIKNLIQPGRH